MAKGKLNETIRVQGMAQIDEVNAKGSGVCSRIKVSDYSVLRERRAKRREICDSKSN
jgi:hypothetical protein